MTAEHGKHPEANFPVSGKRVTLVGAVVGQQHPGAPEAKAGVTAFLSARN